MDEGFRVTGMDSTSVLFEKPIPVRVTKSGCEDRHMELTMRLIMGLSTHHRTTKVLQVQITNEQDPFFLYTMEVNEDDFQSLKVDQCILVDFSTFPYKFIELLEHCIDAEANEAPRFLAVLHVRAGDSNFSVVETNQFKHLSHISLCFRQGNDATVKNYLATRVSQFKATNSDLHEKLKRTLQSLEKALTDVGNLNTELSQMRETSCGSLSELKSQLTLELANVKEKAMIETNELKERMEKERSRMESRLRQQCECQQEKVVELEKQNRSILDSKLGLETRLAELRAKFDSMERDFDEREQECGRLRLENRTLSNEKNEADKMLSRHLLRLTSMEQEIQDKNEKICHLTNQLQSLTSHGEVLDGSLKESHSAVHRAEQKAAASAAEIERCNQLIEKLQADLRSAKAKVKLKGQVANQQDCLLSERQASIDKSMMEISSLRLEISQLKTEASSARKKCDEAQEKYEEAQETIKSNQQMIQWLNQQLTDLQLGKPGSGGTCSSRYLYRPATSYSTQRGTGTCLSSVSTVGGSPSPIAGYKCLFPGTASYMSSVNNKTAGVNLSPGLSSTLSAVNSKLPCAATRARSSPMAAGVTSAKVQYKPYMASTAGNKSGCIQTVGSTGAAAASTNSLNSSTYCFWPNESSSWFSKKQKEAALSSDVPCCPASPPRCQASSAADARGAGGYKSSPPRCQASSMADSRLSGGYKSSPPRCQASGGTSSSPPRGQQAEDFGSSPPPCQASGGYKSSTAFCHSTSMAETRVSGAYKFGGKTSGLTTCSRAGCIDADILPEGWLHPAQG